MSKRIISIIFIAIGLALLAYPKVTEIYSTYQQEKLLREWQEVFASLDQVERSAGKTFPLPQTPAPDSEEKSLIEEPLAEETLTPEEKAKQEYIQNNLEGVLKIEKIDLELPILKGATERNLWISLAHIENTGEMGQPGNYAIAGHRRHTYGRDFNRLDELEIGDSLEVTDGKNTYIYVVNQKLYVEPTDIHVLNSNPDLIEITLITCHPMINPTHRLIIKGALLSEGDL